MATTIQVSEDTIHFLKHLRKEYNAPSYDSLIKIMIQKSLRPQKSLWGAGGKMDMKKILKGLRDENDRY